MDKTKSKKKYYISAQENVFRPKKKKVLCFFFKRDFFTYVHIYTFVQLYMHFFITK